MPTKKTTKKAVAKKPVKVAVDNLDADQAVSVPVKAVASCTPSHRDQRSAQGAGHLVCSQCGKEIPKSFGVVIDGRKVDNCPEDHEAMRAQVGSGHLVCGTCKQQIPNSF